MKTNHRRGFIAKTHTDKAMQSWGEHSDFSGKVAGASIGNDFSNGNRGMARAVRGAKKFVRTRIRAADKMQVRKIQANIE